jgi:two-component system sensor histidine kinase KdpD
MIEERASQSIAGAADLLSGDGQAATAAGAGLLVLIDGRADPEPLLSEAKRLADALSVPWGVLHVETPGWTGREEQTASALSAAAALGATVASVPATNIAEGVAAHLSQTSADYLFVGATPPRRGWLGPQRSLVDELLSRGIEVPVVAVPCTGRPSAGRAGLWQPGVPGAGPRAYVLAALAVAATIPVLLVLARLMGGQALGLLFLFPVITVAARNGFLPAVVATALSVVAYNFFLLRPVYRFTLAAPQNVLMAGTLLLIAGYTSWLTSRLRARALLSDRSAHENAALAAFGLSLTKASDWETTGEIVARDTAALLDVSTAVFREVEGKLVTSGWFPEPPSLGPVDHAALQWAWEHGEEAGNGTGSVASADWQFQPLVTDLGVLAVLALARGDGRAPVRADRKVLLTTLVAQAALAHERLRLEDLQRPPTEADA